MKTISQKTISLQSGGSNKRGVNIQSQFTSDVPIDKGYYDGTGYALRPSFNAGNNVIFTDNTRYTQSESSPTYFEKKIHYVRTSGVYRISFNLWGGDTNKYASGRIYINNVAVGTPRTMINSTPQTFTEDFTLVSGDKISVYIATLNDGYTASTELFTIGVAENILPY